MKKYEGKKQIGGEVRTPHTIHTYTHIHTHIHQHH
jgi:hypothetical protein